MFLILATVSLPYFNQGPIVQQQQQKIVYNFPQNLQLQTVVHSSKCTYLFNMSPPQKPFITPHNLCSKF